jgi:hypothetical protein
LGRGRRERRGKEARRVMGGWEYNWEREDQNAKGKKKGQLKPNIIIQRGVGDRK